MKKYELNNRVVIFGSKEDVWANKVHIRYQNGEERTSLCGKFSRAENLAEIRKESDITCKTCIDLYKKQWRKATPFESDVLAFLNLTNEEQERQAKEANRKTAEEAKRKAEEANRKTAEDAKRKAEEDAKRKAEEAKIHSYQLVESSNMVLEISNTNFKVIENINSENTIKILHKDISSSSANTDNSLIDRLIKSYNYF